MSKKQKIYISNLRITHCPFCNKEIVRAPSLIVENDMVFASSCGNHLFVAPSKKYSHKELITLLQKGNYIVDNTLSVKNYKMRTQDFSQSKTHMMFLLLYSTKYKSIRQIFITSSEDEQSKNCIYYKDTKAIEVTTAVLKDKRGISLDGCAYHILKALYNWDINYNFDKYFPDVLQIREKGGFPSSLTNSNQELIEIYLYSPNKNEFYLTKASYDKMSGYVYMDISLIKKILYTYGKPPIEIFIGDSPKKYKDVEDVGVKDESILHAWGYNVNSADNLTDVERQQMLSEIINLGLMNIEEIINLLEYNINRRKNDKYISAISKWKKDITYIKTKARKKYE